MAQKEKEAEQIPRIFEQPPDAMSLYSDFTQVMGTGNEIVINFYDTIPGPPGPGARIEHVRSRLRVTVTVSRSHAANIGRLLTERSQLSPPRPNAEGEEGQP